MTAEGSGAAPPASSVGRSQPTRPGLLAGLYFLVFMVLACMGTAAGYILFTGYPGLEAPVNKVLYRCGIKFPDVTHISAFDHCAQGAWRGEGLISLGGAATVLALAAVLTAIVPWADRYRLARVGRLQDIPAATARFESLCRESGLTGRRRRPRLVIAGPGLRQAFTAALPGGRPLIVLPAAVAVEHDDTGRFDPVVLHELAHARARDVSWVSSVRWIAWLAVPVVVLPCVLNLRAATTTWQYAAELVLQAAAFAAITVLVAAGLLRYREIEADRVAVAWQGSPEPLRGVLESGGPQAGRPRSGGRLRGVVRAGLRPLARHPPLPARITALRDPLGPNAGGLSMGGFSYALAVGVVATVAMNTSFFIANHLDLMDSGWLPQRVLAVTGSVLLGFGLAPLLLRTAVRTGRNDAAARWWQPVAGTAAGILLGSLAGPGGVYGGISVAEPGGDLPLLAAAALLTASAGAGIVTLAASLASRALGRYPPSRVPGAAAGVALAVIISCCGAAALWPIESITEDWTTGVGPAWLTYVLPGDLWRWLALAYPVGLLALMLRTRIRPGLGPTAIRDAATSLVTPVCAALVGATLVLPADLPATGRWEVATIVGWIVLAVLAVTGGVAGLPRAALCAWLATLLASVELFGYAALTGRPHGLGQLSAAMATPSVWLFYLALPTSCLALVRIRPSAAARRPWTVRAAASAGVAVLAAIFVGTGIAGPLTARDLSRSRQAAFRLVAGPPTQRPAVRAAPPAGDPGRPLTPAAAQRVVRAVGAALSPGWRVDGDAPASSATRIVVRPAACAPLQSRSYLDIRPGPRSQAEDEYQGPAALPLGNEFLTVEVRSYARPIPASVLARARQDLRACHRYTATNPAIPGVFDQTLRAAPAPDVGTPDWREDVTLSYRVERSAVTFIVITAGHNMILITQQAIVAYVVPPPDEAATRTAVTAVMDTLRQGRGTG
jgi:Zn-dependent protease with chaperone function